MKRYMIAILLVTFFCTGCGKNTSEETFSPETVATAFTAKSYVTSPSGEIISQETTEREASAEAQMTPSTDAQPETPVPSQQETIVASQKEIVADVNYDFSTCEDAPILGGETRELDWSMIYDDTCVVIGEYTYPAYLKISDLGSNIELETINIGRVSEDNPNVLNDYYKLFYHGYRVGGIITARTADVNAEDAYIYTWTLGGSNEVPKEKLGILGVSLIQSASEVAEIYPPDESEETKASYYGVGEFNNEKFAFTFTHDRDFATMLSITPDKMMPGIYDLYSKK